MASNFSYLPKSTFWFAESSDTEMGPRCFQDSKSQHMQVAKLQEIEINKLREEYLERLHTLEQDLRCNNLKIFGVQEQLAEDSVMLVLHIFQKKLNLIIGLPEIQSAYRLGNKFPRPIVVRFTSYETMNKVLGRKKMLIGTGIEIGEDLSPERAKLYYKISNYFTDGNVWVKRGLIKVKLPDKSEHQFQSSSEFEEYLKQHKEVDCLPTECYKSRKEESLRWDEGNNCLESDVKSLFDS